VNCEIETLQLSNQSDMTPHNSISETNIEARRRYQYEPLCSSDMIRVLDICKEKSQLVCTINQVPLIGSQYQALSYVWGSQDTPYQIVVVNEANIPQGYLPLTTNLHYAIKDLRDSTSLTSKRFWIDQISINQDDAREKGHQVKFMAQIYHNASRVITYLGPHSQNRDEECKALNLLSRIDNHFRPNYPYLSSGYLMYRYRYDKSELPVRSLRDDISTDDPAWPALIRIVCGPWTQRLWMVQENTLCSNTIMLRGLQMLDWLSVSSILLLFYLRLLPHEILERQSSDLDILYSPSATINPILLTWVKRLAYFYHQDDTAELNTLMENLDSYDRLSCQDPRDFIYSLLGISSDAVELGIKPDYDRSFEEISIQTSILIYQKSQSLYLLETVGNQERRLDSSHPSWAFAGSGKIIGTIGAFDPHPSKTIEPWFEDDNRVMVLTGRIIMKIEFVAQAVEFVNSIWTKETNSRINRQRITAISAVFKRVQLNLDVMHNFIHCLVATTSWAPDGDRVDSAFHTWALYRYLAIQLYSTEGSAIENDASFGTEFHDVLLALREILQNAGRNVEDGPWSPLAEDESRIGMEMYSRALVQGRSMGITETGEFCNITGRACRGDVIALLAGGDVAYVLRPVGNIFRYIGTAYVHELADAAAYAELDKDKVDKEIRIA
jgi:Heterokaryon incompatibility protein (HET)